jgi:hypothetical protein
MNYDDYPEYVILDEFPNYKIYKEGYIIGKYGNISKGSCSEGEKYLCVCIFNKDRKQVKYKIHRLIMKAYCGEANGKEVNHINGDKHDNKLNNLEYIDVADHRRLTHQQNQGHNAKSSIKRGKAVIGISPTGEIKEFDKVSEVNEMLGMDFKSGYIGILIKNNKPLQGWKFSWKEDIIEGEEWKEVLNYPGLETKLQVSNMGRIKTLRVTTFGNINENYYRFSVKINGELKDKKVHEFICWAFNGEKPDWATSVNHIDCNTKNNKSENLEWSNAKLQGQHKSNMLKLKKINISNLIDKINKISIDDTN